MLIPTDASKDIMKKYEELWGKIKDLTRSTNNKSDEYGEKYMKIKFNSDDDLPLKKIIRIARDNKIVRSISNDDDDDDDNDDDDDDDELFCGMVDQRVRYKR